MSNFPLYPTLSEEAKTEAQALIDTFKAKIVKAAEEAIGYLYCDVLFYIESDSWTNFRNELLEGFKDYGNRKIQGEYDFKNIRQVIYKEYKSEIIDDLNQDMIKEIEILKSRIDDMTQNTRREQ